MFPVASATAILSGRDYEFQAPSPRREQIGRRERDRETGSVVILKAKRKSLNRPDQDMTPKPVNIFGLLLVTSFIVIILYREFRFMCRKKNHF